MQFIEKHKFSATLIFGVIVLVTVFYWFEWRPNQIRHYCFKRIGGYPDFSNPLEKGYYESCLAEQGLSK